MAQALGARLLDAHNHEIGLGGGALASLEQIDFGDLDPRLKNVDIQIASDVTNPLTGKNGAAPVFGPQKGADEEMVNILDKNLHHYARKIVAAGGPDVEQTAGAGAAGGLGAD